MSEDKEFSIDGLNVRQRLNIAIGRIRSTDITKDGNNAFSKYKYFTPEGVDQMVFEGISDLELLTVFNLKKIDGEVTGFLDIIDCINGDKISYEMASAIPSITATNVSQQLGGAMTYTRRYMLMSAFMISDNSADFDSQDNTKPVVPELPWLNKDSEQWDKAVKFLKGGGTMATLKTNCKISKKNQELLISEAI